MPSRGTSCVIPTHDRPDLLLKALGSVADQSLVPDEVIVVDDQSSRETQEVVQGWSRQSGIRLEYVDLTTSGGGSAGRSRNAGAAIARFTNIAFLDDDDLWRPQHLEQLNRLLQAGGCDFAVAPISQSKGGVEFAQLRMSSQLRAKHVLTRNPGFTGSNFLIRAQAFRAVGGFDEALRVGNDLDLLVRLLDAGLTYLTGAEITVDQIGHASGQLTSISERRARGLESYRLKHFHRLTRSDKREIARSIHAIRRVTATSLMRRKLHMFLQIANSSPRQAAVSVARVLSGRRSVYHV